MLQSRFRAVFGLEPVLHDFELKWSDCSQQRDALGRVLEEKGLDDAFLQQLFEAFAKTFELGSARAVQPGKTLRRETRNLMIGHGRIFRQRVADPKIAMADQTHDIAR